LLIADCGLIWVYQPISNPQSESIRIPQSEI
jgi:hypothetical protein